MTRRTLIVLPIAVALGVLAGWAVIPPIRELLAPRSVVDVHRLRLGMTADEVRAALGEPAARQFGTWVYGKPGELADTSVSICFDQDHRVCGWTDLATGENVGGMGEVRPAFPSRDPWP